MNFLNWKEIFGRFELAAHGKQKVSGFFAHRLRPVVQVVHYGIHALLCQLGGETS